jgi:hypothetical protein
LLPRFLDIKRGRDGEATQASRNSRRQVLRWARRLGVVTVLAIPATLTFGVGSWQSSQALKITPQGQFPPNNTTTGTDPAPAPPGLRQAASNAAIELVGSGDDSLVAWSPAGGIWGQRDAPPGAVRGWFSPYWWQTALDLLGLVRYLEVTHNTNPIYQHVIDQTFALNVRRPQSNMPVNFGNEFMDDTAWWGLAWLEAARYELNVRHDLSDAKRFESVAEWDANYIWSKPRTCHAAGIEWRVGYPPDTITNAEFVVLAAELAQVQGEPGLWFDPAAASKSLGEGRQILQWLERSRLINVKTGHVWDSYNTNCFLVGGSLNYTEGEAADALVQMGLATGQHEYFTEAQRFINYALSPTSGMTYRGVLQEACEGESGMCQGSQHLSDSTVWKGVFVSAVADWHAATGSSAYNAFLIKQAEAVIDHASSNSQQLTRCQTPHDCQIGFYWARAIAPPATSLPVGPGSQYSGLSAMTAALSTSSSG